MRPTELHVEQESLSAHPASPPACLRSKPIPGFYYNEATTKRDCATGAAVGTPANMSSVIRGVKNITKGYSSVQVKVRNGRILKYMLSAAKR